MTDHLGLSVCPECGAPLALPDDLRQAWERAWGACSEDVARKYFGVRLMRDTLRGQIHASHILQEPRDAQFDDRRASDQRITEHYEHVRDPDAAWGKS